MSTHKRFEDLEVWQKARNQRPAATPLIITQ